MAPFRKNPKMEDVMEDLMNQKPFTPTAAKDMVDEGKSFAETEAGKQLQGELLEMKKKLEAAEKEMKENLAQFEKKEKALTEEMEKNRKEAKERQEKIEKDMDEKIERMAQEARTQRAADQQKLKDMQERSDEERRQMQRDADRRASELQERHERERRQLMASKANVLPSSMDHISRLERLINSTRKKSNEDSKELKKIQARLSKTNKARTKIATKRPQTSISMKDYMANPAVKAYREGQDRIRPPKFSRC